MTKKTVEKTRDINFPETLKCEQNMLGKKIVAKIAKTRFLFSHEYRDVKIGGKKARNNFPEKHEYCEQKMLGKKSPQKSAKTRFLCSHEYRDQKVGGKMRETIIPETHERARKKC